MNVLDLNKPITSKQLTENFKKQFGSNVNLEEYGREQLEDMRNKLRTRVFQQEHSLKYDELSTNEAYQKDQALLKILNTRIKEMLGEDIKKIKDKLDQILEAKKSKPDFLDLDGDGNKTEPMKKAAKDRTQKSAKGKTESQVDEVSFSKPAKSRKPNMPAMSPNPDGERRGGEITRLTDKDREELGKIFGTSQEKKLSEKAVSKKQQKFMGMVHAAQKGEKPASPEVAKVSKGMKKKAAKDFASTKHKGLPEKVKKKKDESIGETAETTQAAANPLQNLVKKITKLSNYKRHAKAVNESIIRLINEDEEAKARAIASAGDIVSDFTGWMQRVGSYQTKVLIELTDDIKANFGASEAETFKASVSQSLAKAMATLTEVREELSGAVAALAGEQPAETPMGSEAGSEAGVEPSQPDEMNLPEPVPAGDEFAASDAAAGEGSAGRELRETKLNKIFESHSIIGRLAR
jgi:hypothetical protein